MTGEFGVGAGSERGQRGVRAGSKRGRSGVGAGSERGLNPEFGVGAGSERGQSLGTRNAEQPAENRFDGRILGETLELIPQDDSGTARGTARRIDAPANEGAHFRSSARAPERMLASP